jgi:hypothetical protein
MDGTRVVATRELLCLVSVGVIGLAIVLSGPARADGSGDPTAVKQIDGKYLDKDGIPTYKIQADGTVDWYTYSGYRRYHSECRLPRPDGEGSLCTGAQEFAKDHEL